MKKEDKKVLIIFVTLCIIVVILLAYNYYHSKVNSDEVRKVDYIFDNYTYSIILNKGENLFQNVMDLLIKDDVFDYERDLKDEVINYTIKGMHNYKKIKSFTLASNTFTDSAKEEYMEYKQVVYHEEEYFMLISSEVETNYVGSIIDYDSYTDNYIYFTSTNYYCSDSEYKGILDDVPECDYTTTTSTFHIVYESNFFKIDELNDFINLI